jgi:hypothetical protein
LTKTLEELNEQFRMRWGREPLGPLIALCADCDEWIFLPTATVHDASNSELFNVEHIGVMPPWALPGRSIRTVMAEIAALKRLEPS